MGFLIFICILFALLAVFLLLCAIHVTTELDTIDDDRQQIIYLEQYRQRSSHKRPSGHP